MSWEDIVKKDRSEKIVYSHELHNYINRLSSDMDKHRKILKEFIDSKPKANEPATYEKIPRSELFHSVAEEIYVILDNIDFYSYIVKLRNALDDEEEVFENYGRR